MDGAVDMNDIRSVCSEQQEVVHLRIVVMQCVPDEIVAFQR